jgi:hypothetical protein
VALEGPPHLTVWLSQKVLHKAESFRRAMVTSGKTSNLFLAVRRVLEEVSGVLEEANDQSSVSLNSHHDVSVSVSSEDFDIVEEEARFVRRNRLLCAVVTTNCIAKCFASLSQPKSEEQFFEMLDRSHSMEKLLHVLERSDCSQLDLPPLLIAETREMLASLGKWLESH